MPGSVDDELIAGCNALIQNGAKLVMSSADILIEFGDRIIIPDLRAFSPSSVSSDGYPIEMKWKLGIKGYSPSARRIILRQAQDERGIKLSGHINVLCYKGWFSGWW